MACKNLLTAAVQILLCAVLIRVLVQDVVETRHRQENHLVKTYPPVVKRTVQSGLSVQLPLHLLNAFGQAVSCQADYADVLALLEKQKDMNKFVHPVQLVRSTGNDSQITTPILISWFELDDFPNLQSDDPRQ
jgi:hypothetical protein